MSLLTRTYAKARAIVRRVRSSKWRAVERRWLAAHNVCEHCGGTAHLQVHHVMPFHLDPALELDPTNLMTLCMGPQECHLRIGHLGNWRNYNPNAREDACSPVSSPVRSWP